MDTLSIINDVSKYSECFSTDLDASATTVNISDEAMNIACNYFKEAFSNITNKDN